MMNWNRREQSRERRERTRTLGVLLLLAGAFLAATAAWAEGETATAETDRMVGETTSSVRDAAQSGAEAAAAATQAVEDWSPVVYIPPSRGQARDTAAGGTRTGANRDSLGRSLSKGLRVAVLAPPDHVALTTRAQPTLYWYVSEDTAERIDLTLVDEESIDPLLEITVPGPVRRGIHSLDLASEGLSLEPDKTYSWHVAIVTDAKRRGADLLDEGLIERAPLSDALRRSIEQASEPYAPYALSGIWYDALSELRGALDAAPQDRRLKRQEAALLEQVDLPEVATYAVKQGVANERP